MTDDLTPHFRRLTHSAALVGEFDGRPERQAELLRWVLEAVRAIAAARGLALEAGQPEPLPPHLSRDLWPAQGSVDEAALVAATPAFPVAWEIDGDVPRLVPMEPDLTGCACQQWPRPAAGHGPPYWTHHHDCPRAPQNLAAQAQGAPIPDDAAWRHRVADGAIRPALFDESEDPDLSGCAGDGPAPHLRTIIEAGAGFAPGELRRPDACDPAEDGAERVMQATETWWGQR